jgi:hypothetical protein
MKIENLAHAEAAISKAETLVKDSKCFAHSATLDETQKALRALYQAVEEELIALKELCAGHR